MGMTKMQIGPYSILNSESAKDLPVIVFWTRAGKTERAKHVGKKGQFQTFADAEQAVRNITRYGTENV